jgi:hypothetical protein
MYRPGPHPGERRVRIPKGGTLAIDYEVTSANELPADREFVIQQLLDANSAAGNAGRFRIERDGELLHVIPTSDKSTAGLFTPHRSVLDAPITFSEEERSGVQKLRAICDAITQATNLRVVVGGFPANVLFPYRDRQGAANQKAREVLMDLLRGAKHGQNLSWRLLYDPEMKEYWLNIHLVPKSRQ